MVWTDGVQGFIEFKQDSRKLWSFGTGIGYHVCFIEQILLKLIIGKKKEIQVETYKFS